MAVLGGILLCSAILCFERCTARIEHNEDGAAAAYLAAAFILGSIALYVLSQSSFTPPPGFDPNAFS